MAVHKEGSREKHDTVCGKKFGYTQVDPITKLLFVLISIALTVLNSESFVRHRCPDVYPSIINNRQSVQIHFAGYWRQYAINCFHGHRAKSRTSRSCNHSF